MGNKKPDTPHIQSAGPEVRAERSEAPLNFFRNKFSSVRNGKSKDDY